VTVFVQLDTAGLWLMTADLRKRSLSHGLILYIPKGDHGELPVCTNNRSAAAMAPVLPSAAQLTASFAASKLSDSTVPSAKHSSPLTASHQDAGPACLQHMSLQFSVSPSVSKGLVLISSPNISVLAPSVPATPWHFCAPESTYI
jgi:hypothetical protein